MKIAWCDQDGAILYRRDARTYEGFIRIEFEADELAKRLGAKTLIADAIPALRHEIRAALLALPGLRSIGAPSPDPSRVIDLPALIYRIITGDGAQLENLDMSDDEWRGAAFDMFGPDCDEHFECTMRLADWLALLSVARAYADGLPVVYGMVNAVREWIRARKALFATYEADGFVAGGPTRAELLFRVAEVKLFEDEFERIARG